MRELQRLAAGVLVALVCASGAAGEELIFDTWSESFVGYQKTGYRHHRIVRTQTGYLEHVTTWSVTERGFSVSKLTIDMDPKCGVVTFVREHKSEFGETLQRVRREGEGLAWTYQAYNQPKLEGSIKGVVYDSGTTAIQMARGERKAEDVTLRVLNLPSGTAERTFAVTKIGDLLHFSSDGWLRVYDSKGVFQQGVSKTREGSVERRTSEAEAKDMSRKLEGKRLAGVEPGKVVVDGLSAVSPGKGWTLACRAPDAEAKAHQRRGGLTLRHVSGVELDASTAPFPLPKEEAARARLAKALETSMSESTPGVTYSKGRAIAAFGLGGLVFEVESRDRLLVQRGSVYFLRRSASHSLLLAVLGPTETGQQAKIDALMKQAAASFKATPLKAVAVVAKRVDLAGGLSMKLPGTWTREPKTGRWRSPGGSVLEVWENAEAKDPRAAALAWAARMAERFKVKPGPVDALWWGGRKGYETRLVAKVSGVNMELVLRAMEGKGKAVFVLAVESPADPQGSLQSILDTGAWK